MRAREMATRARAAPAVGAGPAGAVSTGCASPAGTVFFPEFRGRKIIGALASLYVDGSLVRAAEKQGLVVLGFGEDVMDVLNAPGFVPKTF